MGLHLRPGALKFIRKYEEKFVSPEVDNVGTGGYAQLLADKAQTELL